MNTLFSLLLSIVGGTVKDWVASRAEIAETKARARAQAVSQGIPGWSDEWLVFCWSFPAVACFVPGLDVIAREGMATFQALPEWYQAGFFTVTAAIFGIDKLVKWKGK